MVGFSVDLHTPSSAIEAIITDLTEAKESSGRDIRAEAIEAERLSA
jgi:hypothetical protein